MSGSFPSVRDETLQVLDRLGISRNVFSERGLAAHSPITGEIVATIRPHDLEDATEIIGKAEAACRLWRTIPAPERGSFVRRLGDELRAAKQDLGRLVTLETGKILSEGLGEVQEMIDICDFAVGLSRQLYGRTITSERPEHRMMETWHPLGVCGIITAFNFPVAVWSWNAALALVCGNAIVWKPSEKTPLTALAVQALAERAANRSANVPEGLCALLIGGPEIGTVLVNDPRVPLVSATGSTMMGRKIAPQLAGRFARAILELGGNNAAIVAPSADIDLTIRAVAFAAIGTAGQRCTTLRRLIVHESVYDAIVTRLKRVYATITVGDPRRENTLVGPLIDAHAHGQMARALQEAAALGGMIHGGELVEGVGRPAAHYVRPALVEMPQQSGPILRETFAPILYILKYREFDEAIALHNAVGAGLSSSIFTLDLREAEQFLSVSGSDCGIANVNIGPSGAEIGGAFGGEKETGGGREAGSDAWKAYMRRATNTINYGRNLPLAQGVRFDV